VQANLSDLEYDAKSARRLVSRRCCACTLLIAQQYFGFSDEVIEDALYYSEAIRRFVGTDLGREST
jgi:hypothetical protein